LRAWQTPQTMQDGYAELMQPGEREFHLGFDPRRSRDATACRASLQVFQQRGLTDSRLAAQDKYPALTRLHILHQTI